MKMHELSLAGPDWRVLARNIVLTALAGTCIALVLEADHTRGLPVLVAFALWFTHIFLASALYVMALALALKLGLPILLAFALPVPLVLIAFAPISLLLDYGFGNPDDGELTLATFPSLFFDEIVAVTPLLVVLMMITAFIAYRQLIQADERADEISTDTPVSSEKSAPRLCDLIEGVPPDLGDDLVRMAAQDHYVEIVTSKGRALVTEKFSECVEKLGLNSGLQCHRSHWISLSHIRSVERSGSIYHCVMSNGDRIPVSRRRWADLKKQREAHLFPLTNSGGAQMPVSVR